MAAGGGKDGGGGRGGQEGAPADRSDVGPGEATASGDGAPASHEDDGSSPLVPILIALAVLAAISIGVVTMRRRHQGGDSGGDSSRVSPEAG